MKTVEIEIVESESELSDSQSEIDLEQIEEETIVNLNSQNGDVLQYAQLRRVPIKKRILVIDDEPFNIVSMQLYLSRLGIKGLSSLVDRAYNGLEGVKKVKDALTNDRHVYGLVITDISKPVMDG